MKLGWASDIHLNFLLPDRLHEFHRKLAQTEFDVLLVSGDLAEATDFERHLELLERSLERPIYFVLGNHDFYKGSITSVRDCASELTAKSPFLNWLGAVGVVPLSDSTALVGHDGWGDAVLGDYDNSPLKLTDFVLIEDLRKLTKSERKSKLSQLGVEAGEYLRRHLSEALRFFRHVFVVTHVPPFPAACSTEGRVWTDDWLPYFTCDGVGQVILELAEKWPTRNITVLTGHTHREAFCRPLPNVTCYTAPAEYRSPRLERFFDLDGSVLAS